jgi:hypothetical protein
MVGYGMHGHARSTVANKAHLRETVALFVLDPSVGSTSKDSNIKVDSAETDSDLHLRGPFRDGESGYPGL